MARIICVCTVIILLIVLQLQSVNARQHLNVFILLNPTDFHFATAVTHVQLADMLLNKELVGNLPFPVRVRTSATPFFAPILCVAYKLSMNLRIADCQKGA